MAATNEKMGKFLTRLTIETSDQAEMAELLAELQNRANAGDAKAQNLLTELEGEYQCPINIDFPVNPVKIVSRNDAGRTDNEKEFYERDSANQVAISPLTRQNIVRVVDAKKEFYDSICKKIRDFFIDDLKAKNIVVRKLASGKSSPQRPVSPALSTPPRSASPSSSPLEEQNAQWRSEMMEIRNQCESIKTRMDNILTMESGNSIQTIKSKLQSLLSESTMLNPQIANLSLQTSVANNDLVSQQQALYALLGRLQSKLRRAIDIISTPAPAPALPQQSSSSSSAMSSAQSSAQSLWMPQQTTFGAVSGSPIEPAVGQPIQENYQNPIAPLQAPSPITSTPQQNLAPSSAISSMPEAPQQHQPVSAQYQPAVAANLQTPAEIQIQIQRLRLEIITQFIDRDPLLKESLRVSVNNGQITIRESSGLRLTPEDYQRLYQTLRNDLNNHLPGTNWTLDTQLVTDTSGQNVYVNRMNLIFPGQNLAAQPQHQSFSPAFFAQPMQSHYPVIQQIALAHQARQLQYQAAQSQYPVGSFFQSSVQPQYQAPQPQYQAAQSQYGQAAQPQYYRAGSSLQPLVQQPQQQFAQPQQPFGQPQYAAAPNGNENPSASAFPFNYRRGG